MQNNPYVGWGRPVSGERLIAREQIVKDLLYKLTNSANCSLVGLHRIGKSSIAQEVIRLLQEQFADNFICVDINLKNYKTESEIYEEILYQLVPDEDIICENSPNPFRAFQRFMRNWGKNHKTVIFIDELDQIRDYDNANLILNRFRDFGYDSHYGITFCFISARSLSCIQQEIYGSNLAGICESSYVKPLDIDGISKMAARGGLTSSETIQAIFEISGGHPCLSEALLSHIFSGAEKIDDINADYVQKTIERQDCARVFLDYYSNLKLFFSSWEKGWEVLCDYLVGPLLSKHLELNNLLHEYGIINEQLERPCSKHFYDYLLQVRRLTPTFPIIGDVEKQLRSLVKQVLEKKHGPSWIDKLKAQNPFYQKTFEELGAIMEKEQRQFQLGNYDDLLEYSYPGTLKDIILYSWPDFQKLLGDSKVEFKTAMDAICVVRNPLAHNRPHLISEEAQVLARRKCEWLLSVLEKKDTRNYKP